MFPLLLPRGVNLDELTEIQNKIAKNFDKKDRVRKVRTIAGCDVSFSRKNRACAACVIIDCGTLKVLKKRVIKTKVKFPYIPTFLAFRELEPMGKALKGMDADVYMFGAQGVAHPRRAGLATHLGVLMDRPAIGVAKTRLCGEAREPADRRGAFTKLVDNGETVGAVLRTRKGVKPVYVSVGNKISLNKAIKLTLLVSPKYRLPEPIRLAHAVATECMGRRTQNLLYI